MKKYILLFCFLPVFAQAYRIVTLAPNLAAIVQQAGAGRDLVAVSVDTHYPKRASSLPIVASVSSVNVEKIVSLKPDLVIAWRGGNLLGPVKKLKSLDVPVVAFSFNHFKDISKAIRTVGKLAKTQEIAGQAANKFDRVIRTFRSHYAHQKQVRVFYQVWMEPLMTVTNRTMIGQSIQLCGGLNIFGRAEGESPSVDIEEVVRRNPEAMIGNYPEWEKLWKKWTKIKAVKAKNLFTISDSYLSESDARMVLGIQVLCDDLAIARKRVLR